MTKKSVINSSGPKYNIYDILELTKLAYTETNDNTVTHTPMDMN